MTVKVKVDIEMFSLNGLHPSCHCVHVDGISRTTCFRNERPSNITTTAKVLDTTLIIIFIIINTHIVCNDNEEWTELLCKQECLSALCPVTFNIAKFML